MAKIRKLKQTAYVDAEGNRVPKSHPDARPGKSYLSRKFYGEYLDEHGVRKRVALCTDRADSRRKLALLEQAADRRRWDPNDDFARHMEGTITEHLEPFRAHLEAKGNTKRHVADTKRYVSLVAEGAGIELLRDVTLDRVESFLNELTGRGRSARTVNAYRNAIKSFSAWCVRTGRRPSNPLEGAAKLNEQVDRRRERRVLTAPQLADLLAAADGSETAFRRLEGPDRGMLYRLAIASGLRANELATLTTASLELERDPPCVVVKAAYSKRRRLDEQPLPAWLVEKLGKWLGDKRARSLSVKPQKLFPGSWPRHAAEMLRVDLESAGIAYRDAADQVFDFHALRHQFITTLAAANVNPKIAQTLARHSSIELTLGRYTHMQVADVAGALDVVGEPVRKQQAAATGTADERPSMPVGCPDPGHSGASGGTTVKIGKGTSGADESSQTLSQEEDAEARDLAEDQQPGMRHRISNQVPSQFGYPPLRRGF